MILILMKIIVYIFGIIPDPLAMLGARMLNVIFYVRLKKGKWRFIKVTSVIPKLFPDKDPHWQEKVIKQNSLHYVKLTVEILKAHCKTVRGLEKKVFIKEGKEYLEELLASDRGFTIITGHLGNFEYVAGYIAHVFRPVYAPIMVSNTTGSRMMNWIREGHNVHFVEIRASAGVSSGALIEMIHLLNQGQILFLVADQRGTGGDYKGVLFRKELKMFGGPFIIGQRTRTPFLPMYNYRNENDRIEVHFEEPFYLNGEDLESDIGKVCGFFEKMMREHPDQYLWDRDRW